MPLLALKAASFYYQPSLWVAYRQRSSSILSTMTLHKALDQSGALVDLRRALDAAGCADDAALRFALSHQSARNLIGAMRFVSSQEAALARDTPATELAERVRRNFCDASPLSARELGRAYLRRGWWLRYYKFHHWFHAFSNDH
jgi:hypothetical protein